MQTAAGQAQVLVSAAGLHDFMHETVNMLLLHSVAQSMPSTSTTPQVRNPEDFTYVQAAQAPWHACAGMLMGGLHTDPACADGMMVEAGILGSRKASNTLCCSCADCAHLWPAHCCCWPHTPAAAILCKLSRVLHDK
jgi:hypothetical protein